MKTSQNGIEFVKKWEGFCGEAYTCAAGVWTIGYGHTGTYNGKKVAKGMTITRDAATQLLKADLAKFEKFVNNATYVPFTKSLTQGEFDALVSFAFNLGENNLKKLCVAPRTKAEVADKMLEYNKAGGKVLKGLVDRRKGERAMFLGTATLRRGDKGDDVKKLQKLLGGLVVDGVFGQQTEYAVKLFQAAHGLTIDGIVGPKTWNMLLNM